MRYVFVGGPGRSGTSFVARSIAEHPQVCSFPNVELKFLTEKNGLLDLQHTLVEHYSPNRASVAVDQFNRMADALISGKYGQTALREVSSEEAWQDLFRSFTGSFLKDAHPAQASHASFTSRCQHLLSGVSGLAATLCLQESEAGVPEHKVFLEKTPHALLEMEFLSSISPGATFVHTMRDPRSIAQSIQKMPWGPSDFPQCAEWVSSYCKAWQSAKCVADTKNLYFLELYVEDICSDAELFSLTLCDSIQVEKDPHLFSKSDMTTLNGWSDQIGQNELQAMTESLAPWIERFGYAADQIGHRERGASCFDETRETECA